MFGVRGSQLVQRVASTVTRRSLHSSSVVSARKAPPAPKLLTVNVDGRDIEVPNNYTVLQACEAAGVKVPRFCYHDRLKIAGNCRMCLVEVEKTPKPVASCAMPLAPGMRIKTSTPMVHKAREGVLEILGNDHPWDCPICDQGGECDLQDIKKKYGTVETRYREIARGVEDKNLGPLIKTAMTRCIHCTRCVRTSTELCGVTMLGATGRGHAMEIGTYIEKVVDSELSGNIIDLCPVGALTSKPFAFAARPWELLRHESIDIHDALNANIRIDTRGLEIMRILPRLNEDINEEWIADKSRFSYDALKRQRLDQPMLKGADGEFRPISWLQALETLGQRVQSVKGSEIVGVVGDLVDAEGIVAMKDLLNKLGSSNTVHTGQTSKLPVDTRADYLFNSTVTGIEEADLILLVGTNPRMESPVLCARIRKAVKQQLTPVFSVGPAADLALEHTNLGSNSSVLTDLIAGKSTPLTNAFKVAERPMVIVGMGALKGEGSAIVQSALSALKQTYPKLVDGDWNGINILHSAASRVAAQELGFTPGVNAFSSKAKLVYLLGADEPIERLNINASPDAFVVYQGHHGDIGADQADLILPSPAYTEKSGTYLNLEGRLQRTLKVIGHLANAREDWAIIRALSEVVGKPLPYSSIEEVRQRLADVSPVFGTYDQVEQQSYLPKSVAASTTTSSVTFEPYLTNYFMTDSISRNSKTMAKCAAELPTAKNSYKNQPQPSTTTSKSASAQQPRA